MLKLNIQAHYTLLMDVFKLHPKVDFTLDCILEGTMGNVYVDELISPNVFLVKNGPFYILAGDAQHKNCELINNRIADGATILPSPQCWINNLKASSATKLMPYQRFSFDHRTIKIAQLDKIISTKIDGYYVEKINKKLAKAILTSDDFSYHLQNFSDINDFLQRGIGFVVLANNSNTIVAVASSALVCSKGIEINIMVLPDHRKKRLAKQVAAHLVKAVLVQGKVPHWDAANKISAQLALSLGYQSAGSYQAHRIAKSSNRYS